MSIQVRNLRKAFGDFVALDDVSLDVPGGELVALLGPSGSGKTTLLRIIAGLEPADQGTIHFHGEDGTGQPVRERQVGFVFQHYALFRHMSVFENVAFGLRVRPRRSRPCEAEIRDTVMGLLRLVQLEVLADRRPSELSGGQRQRVALARALAVKPRILLLDEPFGALDAKVRKELRRWLRKLHDEVHITSVFVTHDQEEALDVADQIVVMNEGKIEQQGSPDEVYDHPASPFVYDFLGNVNLFRGRLNHGKLNVGSAQLEAPEHLNVSDIEAVGYVRPHHLSIDRLKQADDAIPAIVKFSHSVGPLVYIEMKLQDSDEYVEAEISKEKFTELNLNIGEVVFVRPKEVRVFVPEYFVIYRFRPEVNLIN